MDYHTTKQIPKNYLSQLKKLIKTTSQTAELKRLQCVYFRGLNYDIMQIAALTQFSVRHIKCVWTSYFNHGIDALLKNVA